MVIDNTIPYKVEFDIYLSEELDSYVYITSSSGEIDLFSFNI